MESWNILFTITSDCRQYSLAIHLFNEILDTAEIKRIRSSGSKKSFMKTDKNPPIWIAYLVMRIREVFFIYTTIRVHFHFLLFLLSGSLSSFISSKTRQHIALRLRFLVFYLHKYGT